MTQGILNSNASRLLLTLLSGLLATPVCAQFGHGLYEFAALPQSWQLNPALRPDARLFVALPGGTASFHAPTFTLSDVLLPVNNNQSRPDFTSVFEKKSGRPMDFSFSAQADWMQIGFAIPGNCYIGIGSGIVLQGNIQLPIDLLRMAQKGNADNYFEQNSLNMSGMGLSAMAYRQHHLAYSHMFNKNWRLGGRLKYLQGMVAFNSRDSRFILNASSDSIRLESDVRIQTAGLPILLSDSGGLDSNLSLVPSDLVQPSRGSGAGFDLGASFAPGDRLNFSFSLTDVGSINWKNDLQAYGGGPNTYTFSGLNYYVALDSLNNFDEQIQASADSFLNTLKIKKVAPETFRTALRTGFHLAASYQPSLRLQCGGVFSTMRAASGLRSAFSSYLQWNPGRFLKIRTSYTFSEGATAHLGGGLCIKMGPLQCYLISDNWSLLFLPERSTLVHAQSGINLLIGSGTSRRTD